MYIYLLGACVVALSVVAYDLGLMKALM